MRKSNGMRIIATIMLAAAIAAPASAATFRFGAIADGAEFQTGAGAKTGFEGNWNAGDNAGTAAVVGNGTRIFSGGLGVRATASNSAGGAADAFFDASFMQRRGGLGVCSSPSCKSGLPGAITHDDNAGPIGGVDGTGGEVLSLNFSQRVALTSIFLRNDLHNPATGSININDSLHEIVAGRLSANSLESLGLNEDFEFEFVPYADSGTAFYIATVSAQPEPIPVPASAAMLGSGLLALGWLRRRRRTA